MARDFTTDDRDKPVYTSAGDRVGTVTDVNDDTARVRQDDDSEGLTDKIKDALGWDDDEDEHDLRSDDVDRYDDDGVYLRDR
ncbi:DUF2171 domain-containing protein [Halomarina salina]|uniref:DUF2171 domain-containing protein n=1 Tax=Halomarina salina TaxID=1872699 RepID=A0ABD5RK69_9EURY|nr:DUF2171 domain-containing protein [Halomarina salina]